MNKFSKLFAAFTLFFAAGMISVSAEEIENNEVADNQANEQTENQATVQNDQTNEQANENSNVQNSDPIKTETNTQATTEEENGIIDQKTLKACIKTDGNVCKLSSDITLTSTITITKNITIDLNGHTIMPSETLKAKTGIILVRRGASLTINDTTGKGLITSGTSGNIYGGIQVASGGSTSATAKLIVNGGTIEGYYYGIVGNGTSHNTDITINGGTIKGAHSASLGIYHPQQGTLTINGGTIEGGTGIEMRSGTLIVNDGIIRGTNIPLKVQPNGSGSTTSGAGIAISQHTTKLPINVTIYGGTIEGYEALYESNPQNNSNVDLSKVFINIDGGTFNAINGGKLSVESQNFTNFVTSGTFSHIIPKEYLVEGKTLYKVSENEYVVGDKVTINVPEELVIKVGETVNDKITITGSDYTTIDYDSKIISVNNHQVTGLNVGISPIIINTNDVYANEDEEYEILNVIVYNVESDKTTENNEASIENKIKELIEAEDIDDVKGIDEDTAEAIIDAIINGDTITTKVEATKTSKNDVKEAALNAIEKLLKSAENVAAYYDINFLLQVDGDEIGKVTELDNKVKVTLTLPSDIKEIKDGYTRTYYIIRIHDGKAERLPVTLNGNKITFETDKFSTYALTYIDTKKTTSKVSNPSTNDNISIYAAFLLLSLGGVVISRRKLETVIED